MIKIPVTYDACSSMVTPMMGRLMVRDAIAAGLDPGKFVMAIEQKVSIESLFVEVTMIASGPATDLVEALKHPYPMTFLGFPIEISATLPPDVIEFRDKTGGLVATLKNLASPLAR